MSEYLTAPTNQRRIVREVSFKDTPYETTKRYSYDSQGNISEEVTSYSGGSLASVSDIRMGYLYDAYGNMISETNSSDTPSRVSRYTYDSVLHQFRTSDIMELVWL